MSQQNRARAGKTDMRDRSPKAVAIYNREVRELINDYLADGQERTAWEILYHTGLFAELRRGALRDHIVQMPDVEIRDMRTASGGRLTKYRRHPPVVATPPQEESTP